MPKDSYASSAAELRGDAYLKLGRADDARKAYAEALANPADMMMGQDSVLKMKLDDLGGNTPAPAAVVVPATEKPAP